MRTDSLTQRSGERGEPRPPKHWPNLGTLLMIERAIKEADMPPRRTELWESLETRPMYQTFKVALEYLEAHDDIMIDKDERVVWVKVDNPKLERLFARATRVR
jgi:hypothetical protein